MFKPALRWLPILLVAIVVPTVANAQITNVTDLTGGFCTSGSEREFTREDRWYADEEVQAGADRHDPAAD